MHNDSEESANDNSPRPSPSPPTTRSRYDSMRRWQQDCPVSDYTTHLLPYTEQAFRVGFTCAIPAISARPLSVVASGESIGSSLAPALPCPPSHGGSISPSSSRSCAEHRSSKARHTGVQALPQNRPPSPPSQHASRPQHEPITALFPSCIAPPARASEHPGPRPRAISRAQNTRSAFTPPRTVAGSAAWLTFPESPSSSE